MVDFHVHNCHDNLIYTHPYSPCSPATSNTALSVFDWIDVRPSSRAAFLPIGRELQAWELDLGSSTPTLSLGPSQCFPPSSAILPARHPRRRSRRSPQGSGTIKTAGIPPGCHSQHSRLLIATRPSLDNHAPPRSTIPPTRHPYHRSRSDSEGCEPSVSHEIVQNPPGCHFQHSLLPALALDNHVSPSPNHSAHLSLPLWLLHQFWVGNLSGDLPVAILCAPSSQSLPAHPTRPSIYPSRWSLALVPMPQALLQDPLSILMARISPA